jgi:hypothetical protein
MASLFVYSGIDREGQINNMKGIGSAFVEIGGIRMERATTFTTDAIFIRALV